MRKPKAKRKLPADWDEEFTEILETIGKNIKRKREKGELRQVDFEEGEMPIDGRQVRRLENGHLNFSLQTLFVISKKLDCSIKDLLRGI